MKALPSWCRFPGWAPQRLTPPRLPLALTLGTTLVLLVAPALLLRQLPRPQAFGLEKLMENVSLLQSFRPNPDRPVPDLWRERLGEPLAERLWRAQTRAWWQFWDGQSAGRPFLAVSSRGLSSATFQGLPVPPLRVGDLVILPPDPVSRQQLSDRLRVRVRPSPGLRLRCLPRLEREQAVFWRPTALGELLGPLAPFLQDLQEGCLTLSIQTDGLTWTGEAASVEGMLLEAPPLRVDATAAAPMAPKADDPLLQLQGTSLERLLAGLLARELIRQPLAERWGFGREQLALLRRAPFRLVLRPLPKGPFQASMELTVLVGKNEQQWKAVLARLAATLQKEGLRFHATPPATPTSPSTSTSTPKPSLTSTPSPTPAAAPSPETATKDHQVAGVIRETSQTASAPKTPARTPWPTALWTREDGVVVGGWQLTTDGGGSGQITFFLGPKAAPPARLLLANLPQRGGMRLLARPRDLARRGLLPPGLPEVVQRSQWIFWSTEPFPGAGPDSPLSQLQGRLVLRP